jgi:hypothetical protein
VLILDRVVSLSKEFTDFVLVDEKRNSIIVNVEKEYFRIVFKEFGRHGFKLKHKTLFKHNDMMTCVFIKEE